MEEGLAPLEVAFWRALLGGICFFAQTGICGGARIPVKHALFFCLFGVLSISVFFSSLQISIQLSGAAMAMVLLYTAPAWVAVFSRILFHESFSSRKGIALGLALFGTALVCFSGGSLNAEPSVLGIVCGLTLPEYSAQLKPLGDGFIKLIKMLIGLIVFCVVAAL